MDARPTHRASVHVSVGVSLPPHHRRIVPPEIRGGTVYLPNVSAGPIILPTIKGGTIRGQVNGKGYGNFLAAGGVGAPVSRPAALPRTGA